MRDLIDAFGARELALETRGLEKRFGRRSALAGLDLAVPKGSVYLLAGPNGAGKTTTMQILMDLLRADSGRAEVLGLPVGTSGPEARAQIGFVPERHDATYRWMRVGRLIRHHSRYFPGWDEVYERDLVARLDVPLEQRFGSLSKGHARRAQLVMALAHRPPLLLLDEPMDGLDPITREKVLGLLAAQLASSPTTVVVATHQVEEVESLVDCLGVLTAGRLVAQQRRERLTTGLHRLRASVPADWEAPAAVQEGVLRSRTAGREIQWTVWGDAEALRKALQETGARVFELRSASLSEAVRDLLTMGVK